MGLGQVGRDGGCVSGGNGAPEADEEDSDQAGDLECLSDGRLGGLGLASAVVAGGRGNYAVVMLFCCGGGGKGE